MGVGDDSVCHWISSKAFIVSFTAYPYEGTSSETKMFLKYTLDDLRTSKSISLPVKHPYFTHSHDEVTLLFRENNEKQAIVWALDEHGVRQATSEETQAFYREQVQEGPHQVKVKAVFQRPIWGHPRRDGNKHDIYLSDRWVRRSESLTDLPIWEPELQLYIWHEYDTEVHTYFMDAEGHYRSWYLGKYVGKIPK